jgi:transposase
VKAVYSLGSGWAVKLTAEVLDLDEQTVRQYFLDYKNQDKKDKKKHPWVKLHYTGKESSLSNEQEQELVKHLDGNLYQRSQDIILYIKKRYKVHYPSGGVKKLLHRLGFSHKNPKFVPGKQDNHLQDLFLRQYRGILKTKGANDVVLFADAVHPTYQTAASCGWIRKGTEKELKTNSGRDRVNINGAINIDSLRMTVDFSESINSASTIRLLTKLERLYPLAEKIHVILDNARYYHSKQVRDWLARHKKIKLHFLPAYCPNLNLIERLWKFFNGKVRNNRYYDTFANFTQACRNFFRCRKKWTKQLRSRITQKFQLFKNNVASN